MGSSNTASTASASRAHRSAEPRSRATKAASASDQRACERIQVSPMDSAYGARFAGRARGIQAPGMAARRRQLELCEQGLRRHGCGDSLSDRALEVRLSDVGITREHGVRAPPAVQFDRGTRILCGSASALPAAGAPPGAEPPDFLVSADEGIRLREQRRRFVEIALQQAQPRGGDGARHAAIRRRAGKREQTFGPPRPSGTKPPTAQW